MNVYGAISDFLKEQGREEWGEMVAKLTGKVYVLMDYGRSPLGLFSSMEDAVLNDDSYEVQEFIVDDLLEWEVGPIYRATILMNSGEITHIFQQDDENRHPTRCRIEERAIDHDWGRIVVGSPISTAHAMQAAMDRRDEIRRMS